MTSLPTTTTTRIPAPRPEGVVLRPGPAAPPARGGANFHQVVALLWRHIWLEIAVFAVVGSLTATAYVLCLRYAKEYTASGRMKIQTDTGSGVSRDARAPDKYAIETAQRDQASRLIHEQTLAKMLGQPEAQQLDWVKAHKDGSEPRLDLLKEKSQANPVPNSTQVEVRVTDRNPVAAAEMVNQLMRFYERQTRSNAMGETQQDRAAINQEKDKIQRNLDRIVRSLDDLRQSPDFEGLERTRIEAFDRVAQLSGLETQGMLYLDQAQRASDSTRAAYQDADAPLSSDIAMQIDGNYAMVQLTDRRQRLYEERAQLEERGFKQYHPAIREVGTRLEEVNAAIASKREELIRQEKDRAIKTVDLNLAAAKSQLETIRLNLNEAKEKKRILENMWAQYVNLEKEKTVNDQQYQSLVERLRDIDVKINRGPSEMVVYNEAPVPRPWDISFPRWEYFLAGGLLLALGLAVGMAVLVETVDTSVRTPLDLSEHVRMPLLGFVPQIQDGSLTHPQICRLAATQPMSLVGESFRQIRTNLLFAAPADQLGSLAVTSAARDEGKTTVAANLAITFAMSGRRVLLVDANFRRPSLAPIFGLTQPVGLSNVLTSQATLAEAACPTDVPNLTVVPTGPPPPNPGELLGSATMQAMLDQARSEYDLVIFDSPPALLVSDALVLATMVDGVVAVVRASQTSHGMVSRLRDSLHRVNARTVGAILNAARPTRGGYFRQSQQQYEDYHNIEA